MDTAAARKPFSYAPKQIRLRGERKGYAKKISAFSYAAVQLARSANAA